MNNKFVDMKIVYIDNIPENIDEGVLYISKKFFTTIHLCACGCKKEVVIPFSKGEWKLSVKHGKVTLYPSIGNWDFPCQSHYWINNDKIIWAIKLSKQFIDETREYENQRLLRQYINKENIIEKIKKFILRR